MFMFINLYSSLFVFMLLRRFCNAPRNTGENEIRKDLVFSRIDQFFNVLDIDGKSNIMLFLPVNVPT